MLVSFVDGIDSLLASVDDESWSIDFSVVSFIAAGAMSALTVDVVDTFSVALVPAVELGLDVELTGVEEFGSIVELETDTFSDGNVVCVVASFFVLSFWVRN